MAWDFQELFRRHAKEIARALRRRGLAEDVAADLTQDTFLRVMASPPGEATQNHNPRAYLFEVSRNLSINYHRRQAIDPTVYVDEDDMIRVADPRPRWKHSSIRARCCGRSPMRSKNCRTRRARPSFFIASMA